MTQAEQQAYEVLLQEAEARAQKWQDLAIREYEDAMKAA